MYFPCGKCYECRMRRASAWSFRLRKQAEVSTSALFVTLTYDTQHVPITPNGFMTLNKRDVQLFFKKLRKKIPKNAPKLKYYHCGEYGGERYRPHYHIILFNTVDYAAIIDSWTTARGQSLGSIHFGTDCGPAAVAYTLKYMCKEGRVGKFARDDRLKEYATMSKGLGLSYLTPAMIEWHKNDVVNRLYIPIEDGKKISIPRYYKEKIYSDADKTAISLHYAAGSVAKQDKFVDYVREHFPNKTLQEVRKDLISSSFLKLHKNELSRNKI